MSYFTQGGVTLWVLIACSLVLVALIAERWTRLRGLEVDQDWLLAQMSMALQSGDLPAATRICEQAPGALARVFEAGLYRIHHSREEIEAAMSTRITQQSQVLEKNMSAIGTMAVVAPFIGLFGTVLGVVRSFRELGGSNPAAVNAGIAEALASTAAGLFVAILAVVCFNYFKNRIRATVASIHVAASQLIEMIVLARSGRPFPIDLRQLAPGPGAWSASPYPAGGPSPQTPSAGHPEALAPRWEVPSTPGVPPPPTRAAQWGTPPPPSVPSEAAATPSWPPPPLPPPPSSQQWPPRDGAMA
jgi:biopolymer transport protein ExbB